MKKDPDYLYLKYPKEYASWSSAKGRCQNRNNPQYCDYGGRGITFCKRWSSFKSFLQDMGKKPSPRHMIDRINNDKGYCRSNCVWTDIKQQTRNRRSNVLITWKGRTQCSFDWSKELGREKAYVSSRLREGWSFAEIVKASQYCKKYGKKKCPNRL